MPLIRKLLKCRHRNLLIFRMGNIFLRHWLDEPRCSHDLYAFQRTEIRVLIKDRKADILVLFKTDKLLAALGENPELAVVVTVLQRRTAHIITGSGRQCAD